MSLVSIDVWSDFVCPFCYLAEPPLARIEAEHAGAISVAWRAFELRPEPAPTLDPNGAYLRDIWAEAVYPMAHERGMLLRLPPVQPRSRLAHEAAAHAGGLGKAAAMNHAIFTAFFERGENIGDVDVLAACAREIGIDESALRTSLGSGRFRAQVLADEALAATLDLSGVPAIIIRRQDEPWERATLISGAQPYEVIAHAVREELNAAG